jgi:hypothetical protein
MDESIDVTSIWTAAGVLLGFQLSVIRWRVDREREMEAADELVWLPPCEYLNLLSMGSTAVGVFVLPALGVVGIEFLRHSFALSILFLSGYSFAIFGHYQLFRHSLPRPRFPRQEKIPFFATLLAAVAYVGWVSNAWSW